MPKGVFISLEGIDGCGKTSLKHAIMDRLTYLQPLSLREPGGTEVSEKIRELLLDVNREGIHARTEAFLYASARCQLVETVIIPALEKGKLVIADRYMDSTLAYQGYGRGLSLDFLIQLNELCTGGVKPDLTLLLDIDPWEGLRRREKEIPDRLEKEGVEFQSRVREGYLHIARSEADRIQVINAAQPREEVLADAMVIINKLLQERT